MRVGVNETLFCEQQFQEPQRTPCALARAQVRNAKQIAPAIKTVGLILRVIGAHSRHRLVRTADCERGTLVVRPVVGTERESALLRTV